MQVLAFINVTSACMTLIIIRDPSLPRASLCGGVVDVAVDVAVDVVVVLILLLIFCPCRWRR